MTPTLTARRPSTASARVVLTMAHELADVARAFVEAHQAHLPPEAYAG